MADVTDANFQSEVLEKSNSVAVVVDLWAPWCGPCKTLGPIIEKVVDETQGQVVLAKVNVDDNPGISQAFKVQSIPAVFAIKDGQVVDSFIGALPESEVRAFVAKLAPGTSEVDFLIEQGDQPSLERALELDPKSVVAAAALGELLIGAGDLERAESLLASFPETEEIARLKSRMRLLQSGVSELLPNELEEELEQLLSQVKGDLEARQRFIDLLALFPAGDPRVVTYRKQMTSRLF